MSDVLLEIGVEELPARFIDSAQEQLETNTRNWLSEARLRYKELMTFATPRRLAIIIKEIADEQETMEEEIRGPKMEIAKNESGDWTKAAIGFTKGQGKTVEDIYTKVEKGSEYIYVTKTTVGEKTNHLLSYLYEVINNLHFPQTMRWGSRDYRFARPLRWITALYDDEVIPMNIAGVISDNVSRGHRFLGNNIIITAPSNYEIQLEQEYVIVDPLKREAAILEGIRQVEAKTPFHVEVEEDLLKEVRNLIEYPTVFYGEFEREYLKLPEEVLKISMKEHQRYFPVYNKEKEALLSFFVSVRNGDSTRLDNVIRGNEKVLRARLQDAIFFYEEDQRHSIDFYNKKLKSVIFQEQIGTVFEKTENIQEMASYMVEVLDVDVETKRTTLRAAEISKFDLVTNMVNEFTELQGIMGEKYALIFNEEVSSAKAVREQYLPIQATDSLPESLQGSVISIADRLDTIAGCFTAGLIPTGSQDPLGLRRQAVGVLRILLANKWDVKIEDLIDQACAAYEMADETIQKKIKQFFQDRAVYLLTDEHLESDVVRAVLNKEIGIFHYTRDKAVQLSEMKQNGNFKSVEEALVRVMNIAKKAVSVSSIKPALFETSSEEALYEMYKKVHQSFTEADQRRDAANALQELTRLEKPIHRFFEENMVMSDHEQVKQNRLALASCLQEMIHEFADLTLVEWKQHQNSHTED